MRGILVKRCWCRREGGIYCKHAGILEREGTQNQHRPLVHEHVSTFIFLFSLNWHCKWTFACPTFHSLNGPLPLVNWYPYCPVNLGAKTNALLQRPYQSIVLFVPHELRYRSIEPYYACFQASPRHLPRGFNWHGSFYPSGLVCELCKYRVHVHITSAVRIRVSRP